VVFRAWLDPWHVPRDRHTGFLDDSFFNVAIRRYGNHAGNMLAMNDEEVFGVRAYGSRNIKSSGHSNFRPGQKNGFLFAADGKQAGKETPRSGKGGKGKRKEKGSKGGNVRWKVPLGIRGSSIVVGSDRLFLAGVKDKVGADDAWEFYDGKKGTRLLVDSRTDGKVMQELTLASVPIFDGMASANGKLFISCADGSLICLAAER